MPRDRIELSTPGFSDQCSTTELPRHYIYIILNLGLTRNKYTRRKYLHGPFQKIFIYLIKPRFYGGIYI